MKASKIVKIVSLALALVLACAAFAGCGTSSSKTVASKADLWGAKIGVQLGTTGDGIASKYEKQEVETDKNGTTVEAIGDAAKVERYNKGAEAVSALKSGKIDCVIIDSQPAAAFVKVNDDLKILDESFDEEQYAACFKKGSDLSAQFNQALKELTEDGTVDKIFANYIGDDIGKSPYESPANVDHSKGTLVMATNATFEPYEFKEGEKIVGIDPMLATAICDKLGYELKIEDMEFDSIITAVQSGKADFGMAGMTVTEDRLKSVDFSDPYTTASQVIIVKK